MKSKYIVVILLVSLLAACGNVSDRSSTDLATLSQVTPTTFTDVTPEEYLANALDIMQQYSINRNRVDWSAIRAEAYEHAQGAQTPADTYGAIEMALKALGDHHSFFLPPDQWGQMEEATVDDYASPEGELIEGCLGYISVMGFASGDQEQINQYATRLQQIVSEVDAQRPCGWIVDLRSNTGGNMWPMLAGIGPILGEGCVGAFVDPDGQETPWCYRNGQALLEDNVIAQVDGPIYQLKDPMPPVAVLTGRKTVSSGEAIVVAFRHRSNTRSFGQNTGGLSTSNRGFPLSDRAWIFLTVSTFADRTGQVYGDVIVPDEVVAFSDSSNSVPQAAIDWLLDQPACLEDR